MVNYMLVPYLDNATEILDRRKDEIEKQYTEIKNMGKTSIDRWKEANDEAAFQMELTMITLGYHFKEVIK